MMASAIETPENNNLLYWYGRTTTLPSITDTEGVLAAEFGN